MSSKQVGVQNLTDDEVDRLLVRGPDSVLGRYLARLRDIGAARPEPDVASRHLEAITGEVEKYRGRRPAGNGRPLWTRSRVIATRIFVPFRRRLAPRNVMVGFAAVVMTAGMAAAATGNLPAPAQDLISKAMARIGIDIPPPEIASTELARVGSAVPVGGVGGQGQDSADKPIVAEPGVPDGGRFGGVPATQPEPSVGELESPEPSVETPTVPPEEPGPAVEEPQDQGPPVDEPDEGPGAGPPANPGPPEHAGPPDHAGPPANPGPPEHAGPPDHAGPHANPGPPEHAGPPDHAGPQANPGPPEHAGPPDHAGPSQSQSRQGDGSG